MNANEHLERIARLDHVWQNIRAQAAPDAPGDSYALTSKLPPTDGEYDLIYAGGGLGLLHAAVMARRYNCRALLFDRGEVGCAHREWNISREELAALVNIGLFSWDELAEIVMNEYERGVVRFYGGPGKQPNELWMRNVLDVALDAGALLMLARRKLEAAGGMVLDNRTFRCVHVSADGPMRVVAEVTRADGTTERYGARLLLDGMGSISPLALRRFGNQPFAGVCPTVGTVVTGLVEGSAPDEHNPQVGDILLSVAHAQRGQQYMWEGFPGRGDELTVYLFYYDTLISRDRETRRQGDKEIAGASRLPLSPSPPLPLSLMQLFEDYFALLPTYKRPGLHFRHIKPVYGYIPARHSVRRQEAPFLRGVLPVGDSAAQQSPLTFCGFGSHVRNLDRTTALLHEALQHDLLAPPNLHAISPYQVNVSLNWVFSRFMQPWRGPASVNELQNIFLGVLNDLGEDAARRFFRDQMHWGDYHRMLLGVFWRHPRIVLDAWHILGARGVRQWIGDYAVYSGAALLARGGHALGPAGRHAVAQLAGLISPAWRLGLLARFAEWRTMGWV
jgi:lycopene cyclase CruA